MFRLVVFLAAAAATAAAAELAFSRIIRGWTDYSTGFNTTHDLRANGEFATVGTFYTPPYTVKALQFATIVIWSELPPDTINFADFTFSACVWSSLDEFIRNPAIGDVLNLNFAQPTTILRDGTSRGGRATYELRFALTNSSVVLTTCQPYVLGVIARTDPARSGELYVPTAPTEGPSDVQAGNIVPFGWQYLVDAGGLTIYDGQLATELLVERLSEPPSLLITRSNATVRLSWPISASCYGLEFADALDNVWHTVTNETQVLKGRYQVIQSIDQSIRYYRLRTPAAEPQAQ